jgi:hypothetical protein
MPIGGGGSRPNDYQPLGFPLKFESFKNRPEVTEWLGVPEQMLRDPLPSAK